MDKAQIIINIFKKNPEKWFNIGQLIEVSKLSPEEVKEIMSSLMESNKLKTMQGPEEFRTYYQLSVSPG